jgi:hypothetical protein
MRARPVRPILAGVLIVLAAAPAAVAQDEGPVRRSAPTSGTTAWFGLPLPPGPSPRPAVVVGNRGPRPVVLPPGEPPAPEMLGTAIRADLEQIVAVSKDSQTRKEIGSGQLWGRIAGFPSGAKTAAWSVEQFKRAGLTDIRVQSVAQDPKAAFWMPLSWQLTLHGDATFGAGSGDLVLHSAMPLAPTEIPGGSLTAPLVYVGNGSSAVLDHVDVKGKIAVQLVVPQAHMVFERDRVVPQAQALMKHGAVAVFNLMRQPGNEPARDFSNCGGPCLNIGGHDGHFLENVLERAAAARVADRLRATVTLETTTRSGLKADNVVAVLKGSASDEVVILNAHYDAWFDGAGDNGDGLAVLMALARHFAKPENRPRRTLVFVSSAGHHTPGLNGPRGFVTANPDLTAKALLMLNMEHVAQRNFSPSRNVAADGYREAIADSGEAPITPGITNRSPFLDTLFDQGVLRYGVNFVSDRSGMQSGETGGYAPVKGAKITVMQAPPLYHTTGETLDVISTPGLERIARFFAWFVKEVDKAPASQINP